MFILKKLRKFLFDPYSRFNYLSNRNFYNKLSDEKYLKKKFKYIMGYDLNLEFPQTFNEKLQWLKINDRNDDYCKMVDKYEVKKYVSNLIGEKYIIPTIGIYNCWDEIDFKELPNEFVIKCTHDSGGIVICKNKKTFDEKSAKKKINKSLRYNYFYSGREWPYKNVKPRIIIEKYMEDSSQNTMRDYKFFCFDGKPEIMYLSEGLENHNTARMSFFDMNFELTTCKRKDYRLLNYCPSKPVNFELMKKFSEILSKNIPHVRIDFYEINGNLYFGEITFFTASGFIPFEDKRWDSKLGNLIKINTKEKKNEN